MRIYIAASWKHQHAVEMLSCLLRQKEHEVLSFVENSHDEWEAVKQIGFEDWVLTPRADKCFDYDTQSAMNSDLVVYIGPSGKDAAAECGMAYAKGVPIIGLYAKGEDFGLMRKIMTTWCDRYMEVLELVEGYAKLKKSA